jgi:zinc protease
MGYWRAKEQEPMRRLGYRMDAVLAGQPFDRAGLRDKVKALSRAEVNAAIKRHLRADRLSIVVVTQDAAGFKAEIEKDTKTPMSYAAPPPADVLAEDKLILARPFGVAGNALFIRAPGDLFEQ